MASSPKTGLLDRLIDLGLFEREAKIYLALLHKRNASSAELQRATGIPQTKIYEITRKLAERGFCRMNKAGHKRCFEAIAPEEAFSEPLRRLEKKYKKAEDLRADLVRIYHSVEKCKEPLEYIEILHGKESIHHYYCKLLRSAVRETLGFGRPPYSCDTDEKIREQTKENEAFLARGGASRWVYEVDSLNQDWLKQVFSSQLSKGMQVRITEKLPMKMVIFDTRTVLVTPEDPVLQSDGATIAAIQQRTVAIAYKALFDFFWNQASDVEFWFEPDYKRGRITTTADTKMSKIFPVREVAKPNQGIRE
jgi:sugar-specific transcriptional regulator TrmB